MKLAVYAASGMLLGLAGCASGPAYISPTTSPPRVSEPISAPRKETLDAAKRALVAAGYQITSADESAGTISTAPLTQPLKDTDADCGKGEADYLQDPKTTTAVSMGVIVAAGLVNVQATIQGTYKPGGERTDTTLVCVSRGALEEDMVQRIRQQLPVHIP